MKFRCERDVLVDALATAQRATSTRATLPVLSGLRLSLAGNQLRLTGSDLDLTITTEILVSGEVDGVAVLPAKFAVDIVRSLEGGAIEVETDGEDARDQRWSLELPAAHDPCGRVPEPDRSRRGEGRARSPPISPRA